VTGSPRDGKTTLALAILSTINPDSTVIVNPGAEKKYYDLFGEARTTVDTSFPKIQHVAPQIYQDKRDYDQIWWPIVMHGNVYTLNDEVSVTATESRYGPGMSYHVQQGRRRNCGQIALTQRLHRVPLFLIDLTDHLFIGYVQGRDLERLERDTQRSWSGLMQTRQEHQFSYWSKHRGGDPVLLPL